MLKCFVAYVLLSFLLLVVSPLMPVYGCSCGWSGPFLTVSSNAQIIVRGKVLAYKGEARGVKLSMDFEVLEVIKGKLNKKTIRVWGDNGALCRPCVTQFPIGTEWILALNGLGSKPGIESEYAISVCGTYWLKVEEGKVIGNIDNKEVMDSSQSMPLDEFRAYYSPVDK